MGTWGAVLTDHTSASGVRGATARATLPAEFVAVLIIVAALIAAIWGSGITDKVDDCATKAKDRLFQKEAEVGC